MIHAKLRITGTRPRIEKILERFLIYELSIQETADSSILKLSVPTPAALKEIARRLKAKKDRPGTKVEILEMEME
jgi:hypothetical protein